MTSPATTTAPDARPGTGLPRLGARVRAGAIGAALLELDALAHHRPALADEDDAWLLALRVDCRLARGDLGEAMRTGDLLAPYAAHAGLAGAHARQAKGELAAALGDPDSAVEHFLAVGRSAPEPEPLELLAWRPGAALALVRTGRRQEAVELATDYRRLAAAQGSPYALGQALRTLAAADSGGARTGLLREARGVLAGVGADRLAAQVDADLAGLLLLGNDPRDVPEAVGLLRDAEAYAGREELWPLQGRVRRLLDRCGEAPRRVRTEALGMLTVSERRVARLAADGLTNRQAAEQLRVSVKAVEWHLSRIYRKLGISSRAALGPALGVPA